MADDITPNRGSNTPGSPPPGDPFASDDSYLVRSGQQPSAFEDADGVYNDGYEPGEQTRQFGQNMNRPTVDSVGPGGYEPANSQPANFEDPYESQNAANFNDPEYQKGKQAPQRDIMAEARKIAARGKADMAKRTTRNMGETLLGDKHAFRTDSPENRDRVKQEVEKRLKEEASERIGKRIGNEVARKAFQEGLSKGSKDLAKKGAQQATKAATKAVTKTAAKAGARAGAEAAVGGAETAIAGAGLATGAASFGLGFLLSLLLNIAISLGVSDAIDAAFELNAGNFAKARFFAIRAAMKVGMFILLLVTLLSLISVGAWIIGVPLLLYLNIYMVIGLFFKKFAYFQGLVWWEMLIIVCLDFLALIILAAFLAALGWWICDQSGFGGGTLSNAATSVYDWWTGSTYASTVNEMCTAIKGISQ